ncbi:MAG: FAD:protein FMN transferase, partial [Alistipes sp.]|nr:FAD:protein FMN transferase [Alistipes sp.]
SHPWGACWRVSLTNPWTGASLRDFELRDRALSTSGNTPAYTGHIVDPTSGRRIDGRRMATVVAEDALDAEVLSTVLMIADAERRERILARFPQASGEIYEL